MLWERLDAAHTEAAAVAAATTSAVAQIGAAQPRAIPRVTGISKRKQRQLELNRRLGFVVDDADEAGEPTIPLDSGYGSRRRPMPLGTKRKYNVYEYAPDSTGLSKFTQPRIRALGRLQARWRGFRARRHGAVEMERDRRAQDVRRADLRRRFRIVVARVLLLLMATGDWRDTSKRAVRPLYNWPCAHQYVGKYQSCMV